MPNINIVVAYTREGHTQSTSSEYEVTTNLTETDLGGALYKAVHTAWAMGIDPTDMTIVVSFGPRPSSPFRRPT